MSEAGGSLYLVMRVGAELVALPVSDVSETLRPLPTEPLPDAPDFVLGVAIIRGTPTPVVNVAKLLAGSSANTTRFVVLGVANRTVALAVDAVLGVQRLMHAERAPLPPLLAHADRRAIEALGLLDSALLVVLQTARLVSQVPALEAPVAGRA